VSHIVDTGAPTVVTANPGCILQIQQGLKARGRNVEVRHIIEILDEAYGH
jgi:glycolate oxidase iron-sulfur subunit